MPVADPTSGRLFIWLISCFLFSCIAAGGSFLISYIVLPHDPSRNWLPVAGVTLVCLPWAFWLLTWFYRVISRACGFRVVVGGRNPGAGGGAGGGRTRSNAFNTAGNLPSNNESMNPESPSGSAGGGEGRGSQFLGAVAAGEHDRDGGLSICSHESEMPLRSAMAS